MWIMLKLSVFSLLAHLANATIIFMMIPRPIGYFHTDPVHMYSESRVSWSNSAILLISTTLHESWEWTKQQSPSKKEEEEEELSSKQLLGTNFILSVNRNTIRQYAWYVTSVTWWFGLYTISVANVTSMILVEFFCSFRCYFILLGQNGGNNEHTTNNACHPFWC